VIETSWKALAAMAANTHASANALKHGEALAAMVMRNDSAAYVQNHVDVAAMIRKEGQSGTALNLALRVCHVAVMMRNDAESIVQNQALRFCREEYVVNAQASWNDALANARASWHEALQLGPRSSAKMELKLCIRVRGRK
jgi:uncharacterized protein (UPF0261 family)